MRGVKIDGGMLAKQRVQTARQITFAPGKVFNYPILFVGL